MRDIVAAAEPFKREEWTKAAGARALLARATTIRTSARSSKASPTTSRSASTGRAPTGSTCAAGRTSPTRRASGVQADERRRRVLARRREAPHAAAHLRHGLADPGAARPLPVAGRGGRAPRPPQAGQRAGAVHFFDLSRRASPSGCPKALRIMPTSSKRCSQTSSSTRGYQESARRAGQVGPVASAPATGTTTRRTCSKLEVEDEEYAFKPMNCPSRTLVYRFKTRSYRDLPLRLARLRHVLLRNERSGTLNGLLRVRAADAWTTRTSSVDRIRSRTRFAACSSSIEDDLSTCSACSRRYYLGTRPATRRSRRPELWDAAEADLQAALEAERPGVRGQRGRGRLLRAEDRRRHPGRAGPPVAARHDPARLSTCRALRARVRRRGRPGAPAGDDPSRDLSAR